MKSKIGTKLVIAVVLFSSLITFISTVLQLYLDYRADIQRVSNYDTMITDSYLKSISTSVWMYDENQILTQLNGILHLPDMERIEIHSDEGPVWSVGDVKSRHNLTKEFPLLYVYKGENVVIGTLQVIVSLDGIYARLLNKTLTILAANAIKTFLVSGFLLILFQYFVTRHLYSLNYWLKNLDIGKSFEQFHLDRGPKDIRKNDELDEVVQAINEMQDNLRHFLNDLIKSENKYKILTENIPLKVFHKDVDSVYVACNRNFAKDLKISADHITGKTDYDFFPKDLADKYRFDDRQIMTSNKIETYEERYISPGGQESIVQTIKTPIWDEDNRVVGLLGTFIDVTELKMTKHALQESEEKFHRLIENLQETHFFYRHDAKGRFTYLSPSVTHVLGYDADNFSKHFNSYLTQSPVNKDALNRTVMSIKGQIQPPYDYEIVHKNGSIRYLQVTETPVFDDHGNVVSVEGLAHDITDVKNIETQLRHALKMEAIGTLAGGIAHDFNNILSVILGYTEMARDDVTDNSTIANDLDEVLQAGRRAKDLVKQILAFSRQSELECIPMQPAVIIKEAVKMLRHSIPATIAIHTEIDPASRLIMADPTQIHQILINLCTNAFHAMEQSGGDIFISLQNRDLNDTNPPLTGAFVELSVRDTGPGIQSSIKDKIFDPYFTTKDVGKGTGMGLAIVHGIIKSYGGIITVESDLGKGTVFQLYFPVAQLEISKDKHEEPVQTGTERILFVDDELSLAQMGKDMLTRLGYSVTTLNSSAEALELFRSQPDQFDLIITDQTMPGMTGVELAKKIMLIRSDIPIILCTGYSSIVSEEQAKALGIREFVLKPMVKWDVARLIRRVLDNQK